MTTLQPKLFPAADAAGFGGNDPALAESQHRDDDMVQVLSELRTTLAKLRSDVAAVAERRAAAVATSVADGAEQLRGEIRKAPGIAIAVAALAGILIAVAVTSGRPQEPAWRQTARRYRSAMSDDVDALMAQASRVGGGVRDATSGLMPSIERLAQKLSEMDLNNQLAPALEKGSTLLRSAWQTLTGNR